VNLFVNFIDAAMSRARYEWLNEDDGYYGRIPELPGVWATGDTVDECAMELREVLEDWIALGAKFGHPLPETFNQPPS
jgi:predicted RNase H-like HicB family nuclease